ncbi:hypothetical protein [Bartonella harrusi]|uniref:hypothetical protein n=1 Tax=Bartonella harrusi TaxID=2961895 RepID=UPI0035A81C47
MQNTVSSHLIGASSISLLHLIDSSLIFEQPNSSEAGHDQTLRVEKDQVRFIGRRGMHVFISIHI